MHAVARWQAVGLLVLVSVVTCARAERAGVGGKEVLQRAGLQKGICVVLGLPKADGPALVVDLAARSELTVYFQSPNAAEELAVRKAAPSGRTAGQAGLRRSRPVAANPPGRQPGRRRLGRRRPPEAKCRRHEVLRVLHPEGKAIVGGRGDRQALPGRASTPGAIPTTARTTTRSRRDQLARRPYLTQFLAEPMFCPMPEVTVAAGGRVFKAFGHIAHKANQNADAQHAAGHQRLQRHDPLEAAAARGLHDPPQHDDRHARDALPGRRRVVQADRRAHRRSSRTRSSFPTGVADGTVWKWMALEAGADGRPCSTPWSAARRSGPRQSPRRAAGLGHWPWGMWEGHDYKDPKTNFGFGRTFVAIDPQTKKVLWNHREQDYLDSRGVCMKDGRIYFYSPEKFLALPRRRHGQGAVEELRRRVCWRPSARPARPRIPARATPRPRYIKCNDKYLFFAGPQRPNLVVASADDGKLRLAEARRQPPPRPARRRLLRRRAGRRQVRPTTPGRSLAPLPNRRSCTRATGSVDSIFYRAAEGTVQIDTADDHAAAHRAHAAALPGRRGHRQRHALLGAVDVRLPAVALRPRRPGAGRGVSTTGPGADASRLEPGEGDPAAVEHAGGPARRLALLPRATTAGPSRHRDRRAASRCRPAVDVPAAVARPAHGAGHRRRTGLRGRRPRRAARAGRGHRQAALAGLHGRGRSSSRRPSGKAALYAGSADGRVYAFEAATGRRLWTLPRRAGRALDSRLRQADLHLAGGRRRGGRGRRASTPRPASPTTTAPTSTPWTRSPARSSGTTTPRARSREQVQSGISLQGELSLQGDALCFPGGSVYQTARYDLKTGECLNEPVHQVGSRTATAFYPYYPEYGQFTSLEHTLARRPDAQLRGALRRQPPRALAMLQPLQGGAGAAAQLATWPGRRTRSRRRETAGTSRRRASSTPSSSRATCSWPPARRARRRSSAAIRLQDGSSLWEEESPGSAGQRRPGLRPPGTDLRFAQRRPDQLLRSQQIVSDKGTDYSARWTGFLQPTTSEELRLTLRRLRGRRGLVRQPPCDRCPRPAAWGQGRLQDRLRWPTRGREEVPAHGRVLQVCGRLERTPQLASDSLVGEPPH